LRKRIRDRRQRLLLALARRGNEDAFTQLYRELFPPVARYIQTRIQNRGDAEDLCADVFKKFLTGLDRFDPSCGSVMTWVVCLARNTVIDEYRRKRPTIRGFDTVSGLLAGTLPDGRPGPLHILIGDEEMKRVRQALARQPSEIREMFALRFDQGLRVREVAEVMGLSPDAAKQRFARALRVLRRELAETETSRRGEEPCADND
jgi:RNA polymerase sigma-70 factor, ECF subfamily